MSSEYEATQALQSIFDQYEPRQEFRRGLLGNSGGTVMVPSRPGWAYIRYREDLSRLSQVRYLLQEQLPDETPVVVGKKHPTDPFDQVLSVDWAMYGWAPLSGTVQQWATQVVTLNDLAPGKIVPTNPYSLSVDARAFLYVNGDEAVEYGGGQIDLTGSVPGVAGHRLTLVYIDLDTDALASTDGAIVAIGTDAVAPTVPENSVPLAVVDLANGDTEILAEAIYQYKVIYDSVGGEIPLSMLGDYARGHIIRGGAADWEAYDASTDGAALYGDGTDILSGVNPNWLGTHTWTPGDDQGIILEMDAAQSVDIFQIKDSGGNIVSGYDERGIPFADGDTDPTNYFAGADAGNPAATATQVTLTGSQSGRFLTTGDDNSAYGTETLNQVQTGIENAAFGSLSIKGNGGLGGSDVNGNSAFGALTLRNVLTGADDNTVGGRYSGFGLTTGTRDIFFGAYSGYRQTTASDRLLVDNRLRADIATELTNAILYGTMAATPDKCHPLWNDGRDPRRPTAHDQRGITRSREPHHERGFSLHHRPW
jgi:hypothetical protein